MPAPHNSIFDRPDPLPDAQYQKCQSTEGNQQTCLYTLIYAQQS